jgi:hypothetical protein
MDGEVGFCRKGLDDSLHCHVRTRTEWALPQENDRSVVLMTPVCRRRKCVVRYRDISVFYVFEMLLSSLPAVKHGAFFEDQLTLFIYSY